MAANVGMGLNLLLLLAMVGTNIVSLYHLISTTSSSSNSTTPSPLPNDQIPEHLLRQLHTIRATISHLTHLHNPTSTKATSNSSPPAELLLYSRLAPIASACADHPDLLHKYMSYTPFTYCPDHSTSIAEQLMLRGCHPLPRRRCFSKTNSVPLNSLPRHPFARLPDSAVRWPSNSQCRSFSCLPKNLGFDVANTETTRFMSGKSALDLPLPQLLKLAETHRAAPIRLGLDVGGGTGTLAARLRLIANATVLTTTMNLGAPYSEAAALRGLVPLHAPLQQRFPVADGVLDLVRTGHAVNRWIPEPVLEFLLFDADRVLRPGGLLWIDHFFCRKADLELVYTPMVKRIGYPIIKWAVGDKNDGSGVKNREVYLTALLQKPFTAAKAA